MLHFPKVLSQIFSTNDVSQSYVVIILGNVSPSHKIVTLFGEQIWERKFGKHSISWGSVLYTFCVLGLRLSTLSNEWFTC
jgi:hypothetical protein